MYCPGSAERSETNGLRARSALPRPGSLENPIFRTHDFLHNPCDRTEIQPQMLISPYIYIAESHRPTCSTRQCQPVENPKESL